MTTRDDSEGKAFIQVRCSTSEKEMMRKVSKYEGRTETQQVLYWLKREYEKIFGASR